MPPMDSGFQIVAAWDGDHLTLYDSSQNIFAVQQTMSRLFGIPTENVHIMSQFVGGAFGSKGSTCDDRTSMAGQLELAYQHSHK